MWPCRWLAQVANDPKLTRAILASRGRTVKWLAYHADLPELIRYPCCSPPARVLGLTIPEPFLQSADEVIE